MFISGSDNYKDRYRGLQVGADDFLSKQTPIRELLIRIQLLLTRYSDLSPKAKVQGPTGTAEATGTGMEGQLEVIGGVLLKAIAVWFWKLINKLHGSALEPYLNLADLYAKQGLMVQAKGQYQIVVDEYIKRSRIREAGDALKKMADIDPTDLKIRSMLAELYIRDGNSAKAVGEHVAIAEVLSKKGHMAEALQVLEKGLKIDPKSAKLRIALAEIHLAQGNHDKALYYLEDAFKDAPSDS